MTTVTWKSLAQDLLAGKIELETAAKLAASFELPVQKRDIDGEVWFDGEQDNTSEAVYAILDYNDATEFLVRIAEFRN